MTEVLAAIAISLAILTVPILIAVLRIALSIESSAAKRGPAIASAEELGEEPVEVEADVVSLRSFVAAGVKSVDERASAETFETASRFFQLVSGLERTRHLEDTRDILGRRRLKGTVVSFSGEILGNILDIHYDATTAEPQWVSVQISNGAEKLVPLGNAEIGRWVIRAPISQPSVTRSPNVSDGPFLLPEDVASAEKYYLNAGARPATRLPAGSSKSSATRRHYLPTGVAVALDAFCALFSVLLLHATQGIETSPIHLTSTFISATVLVLASLATTIIWPLLLFVFAAYRTSSSAPATAGVRSVGVAALALVVIGAALVSASQAEDLLASVFVLGLSVCVTTLAARLTVVALRQHLWRRGRGMRRTVIVGDRGAVVDVLERLAANQSFGLRIVGVFVPEDQPEAIIDVPVPVLGSPRSVISLVQSAAFDTILVAGGFGASDDYVRELSAATSKDDIDVLIAPGVTEVFEPRVHLITSAAMSLLRVDPPRAGRARRVFKRLFDVLVSIISLMVLSPLLVLISAAIKLEDGGPILFRQERVGLAGHKFMILKFRTMVPDSDKRLADLLTEARSKGSLFKLANDPRITAVGRVLRKYSLDELPQLLNIVTGTMSLVGPRPHLESDLASIGRQVARRELVKPGLTGLWQVSGRSDLSWDQAIQLDLRYVENWSLSLDLVIVLRTFFAVLSQRGAY